MGYILDTYKGETDLGYDSEIGKHNVYSYSKQVFHFYCDSCGSWEYSFDEGFEFLYKPTVEDEYKPVPYVDPKKAYLLCTVCGHKWKQEFSNQKEIANPLNRTLNDVPSQNQWENHLDGDLSIEAIRRKNPNYKESAEPIKLPCLLKAIIIFLSISIIIYIVIMSQAHY